MTAWDLSVLLCTCESGKTDGLGLILFLVVVQPH